MYANVNVYTCLRVCVRVCVCVPVRMHVCVCVCMRGVMGGTSQIRWQET